MEELKLCPFCGGEAKKVLTDEFKIREEAYQSYLRAYGKADCEEECYLDALEAAINALKKLAEITKILESADFNNMVSKNEIGEDYGLRESMCAISLIVDGKYRW